MFSTLASLLPKRTRRPSSERPAAPTRRARLGVESLEERQLLSTTPLTPVSEKEPNNGVIRAGTGPNHWTDVQRLDRAPGTAGWDISATYSRFWYTPHRPDSGYWHPDSDVYVFHVEAGERFRIVGGTFGEEHGVSSYADEWGQSPTYDGNDWEKSRALGLGGNPSNEYIFARRPVDVVIRANQFGMDGTEDIGTYPYRLKIIFESDVRVSDARFDDDARSVLFDRSAIGSTGSYKVKVYQSATDTFVPSNRPTFLGEQTFSGSGASRIDLGQEIKVDPLRPYILVVADPDKAVTESNEQNNVASFEHRITAKLVNGSLIVNGTNAGDRIFVRKDNYRISVQGAKIFHQGLGRYLPWVPASTVKLIQVAGRRGSDRIRLDQGGQPLKVKSLLEGGAGDDTIYGGHGSDWIYGGNGNDSLHGGWGNDYLFGEEGNNDKLYGDKDNDWLDAGSDAERDVHAGPRGDKDWNAYQWVKDGARMTDFAQQFRGNCFFLASLGALAQRGKFDLMGPDRVRYKGEFTYEVKLYDGDISGDFTDDDGNWVIAHKGTNQWVWVTVRFDGTVASSDPRPVGNNEFGEFWFVLYRRAYLKLTGLLDEGGFPSEALRALTGRGSTWVGNTADEEFFSKLETAVNLHHRPVVASTHGAVISPKLVGPHAYIVASVERRRGEPFAVTLWNPHGRLETVSWADFRRNMQGFDLHDGVSA